MSSAPDTIGPAPPDGAAYPRLFSHFTSSSEEIDLWFLSLPQLPLEPNLARLSGTERQRADRFARREDFERFVKGRGALRLLLAACSGQPIEALDLAADQDGKPRLRRNAAGLEFNLSHSGGYVLIGIGRRPLGVDIECVGRATDWQRIAAHAFHPQERAALAAFPSEERRDAFFQIWTRKEAYLKGIGRGLAGNLADFATATPAGEVDDGSGGGTRATWHTAPLAAPAGYKAAVAAPFRIDGCNLVIRTALRPPRAE